MAVVKKTSDGGMTFECPGCQFRHKVMVGQGPGPRWGWNGSVDLPTFTPSVLVSWKEPSSIESEFDDPDKDIQKVCHSFVRDGNIQFLNDCSHSLAGQTVPLPVLNDQ